jgi:putative SOS response-associated peptidase YedK
MCGRYDLTELPLELFEQMVGEAIRKQRRELRGPRYNIAPSQAVPIIRRGSDGQLELVETRWGLLPFWAKQSKVSYNTINARAETVERSPSYREPLKNRRCLVPATGWYEWQSVVGQANKQPWRMHLRGDQPLAFAGLWDHWSGEGQTIESNTIIVTDAAPGLRTMHDRMPVILSPEGARVWMDAKEHDPARLKAWLKPYAPPELEAYRVSTRVNNAKTDSRDLITPADGEIVGVGDR